MSAKKKYKSSENNSDKTLNMKDAALFRRMESVFISRGFGGTSLVKQATKAISEWCDNNEAQTSKNTN